MGFVRGTGSNCYRYTNAYTGSDEHSHTDTDPDCHQSQRSHSYSYSYREANSYTDIDHDKNAHTDRHTRRTEVIFADGFESGNLSAWSSSITDIILRGYSGSSTIALRVEFGYGANGYQIRAGAINDGSTWTETSWFPLSDAPHAIQLDWRAANGAGMDNGGLVLWIDGVQKQMLTGIDNDTRRMERVLLGALASIDTGTRGTYYFDAFESER